MKKLSLKEMDKRKSRYYGMLQFYNNMKQKCFGGICLIWNKDGYEAFFEDAEIASKLTSLPVTPDDGFVRLLVCKTAIQSVVDAILADGRKAAVIGPDESGVDTIHHYYPDDGVTKGGTEEDENSNIDEVIHSLGINEKVALLNALKVFMAVAKAAQNTELVAV